MSNSALEPMFTTIPAFIGAIMLTNEQKLLVEQWQYVPQWIVFSRLGVDSPVVRRAVDQLGGSVDDLLQELILYGVVRAVQTYQPDRGCIFKSWVARLCFQRLFGLAQVRKRRLQYFQHSDENTEHLIPAREVPDSPPDIPLHGLTPKEQLIITRRYGLVGEPQTLAQVAEHFGITRERVRQLQARALDKLQDTTRV